MSRKINLTNLTFKPTISGAAITEDLHKAIAEAIYQNATTLSAHAFALKLYEAEGDIEVSDSDIKHIKDVLPGFKYFAQEAILKAIGENGTED